MTSSPPAAPFMTGWRVAAANVLSGSVVVIALSSAIASASGAAVAAADPGAPRLRVQLGLSPVAVAWPAPDRSTFLEVEATGTAEGYAVLEGLPRDGSLELCSLPWTAGGRCTGARAHVGHDGRDGAARVALEAGRGHLKVTTSGVGGGRLVLRTP